MGDIILWSNLSKLISDRSKQIIESMLGDRLQSVSFKINCSLEELGSFGLAFSHYGIHEISICEGLSPQEFEITLVHEICHVRQSIEQFPSIQFYPTDNPDLRKTLIDCVGDIYSFITDLDVYKRMFELGYPMHVQFESDVKILEERFNFGVSGRDLFLWGMRFSLPRIGIEFCIQNDPRNEEYYPLLFRLNNHADTIDNLHKAISAVIQITRRFGFGSDDGRILIMGCIIEILNLWDHFYIQQRNLKIQGFDQLMRLYHQERDFLDSLKGSC